MNEAEKRRKAWRSPFFYSLERRETPLGRRRRRRGGESGEVLLRRLGRVGGVRAAAAAAQTAAPRLVGVTERSSTSAAPSESRSGEAPPSRRPSADADASRRSARRRSMPGAPVSFLLRVHPLVLARHGHRWPAATPSARPRSRAPTSSLASLPLVHIMHVLGNPSPSGWGAHYIERSLVQTRDHVRCYKSAGSGCTRIDRIRSRDRVVVPGRTVAHRQSASIGGPKKSE